VAKSFLILAVLLKKLKRIDDQSISVLLHSLDRFA
jgi:hypothetical protein